MQRVRALNKTQFTKRTTHSPRHLKWTATEMLHFVEIEKKEKVFKAQKSKKRECIY